MTPHTLLDSLISASSVPGVSMAVIRDGVLTMTAVGVRDKVNGEPVDDQTVFDAASLSKPMVAYAVLQLVDAGMINLDESLSAYVSPIVEDSPDAAKITARHILTHTSGLPNLGSKDPLQVHFQPGTRFSYSSVGFSYLQRAVEAITGESLETNMKRLVFEPLGMRSSSFEWQHQFASNVAQPHENGEQLDKHRPPRASASYSLQTTATDYGAFLAAVLRGDRLKEATSKQWLTPAIHATKGTAEHLDSVPAETEIDIAWGLGWGLELSCGTFFQWGKITGVRAFVMGSRPEQSGVVLFTNSNTGLRLMSDIACAVLPGEHPAIEWLKHCVSED